MKTNTIFSILFLITISINALSQEIRNDTVVIILPKGSKKINKPQMIYNPKDGTVDIFKGGEYEYEGMFMSYHFGKINGDKNFLSKIKNSQENRRNRLKLSNKNYKNSLGTIHKNFVFIYNDEYTDFYYYGFYVVNKNYTYAVSGSIDYDAGEEQKAKKVLNMILKNITFLK